LPSDSHPLGPQRIDVTSSTNSTFISVKSAKIRLLGGSGERRGGRAVVALQELQGLLIELLDLLVDGSVRTPFKDQRLGTANIAPHLIGKTSGGCLVGTSEGYLRRRRDPTKLRRYIMSDYSTS
jgi:hypothetical protein